MTTLLEIRQAMPKNTLSVIQLGATSTDEGENCLGMGIRSQVGLGDNLESGSCFV